MLVEVTVVELVTAVDRVTSDGLLGLPPGAALEEVIVTGPYPIEFMADTRTQ